MEEESREKRFEREIKLHEKYGVSKEHLDDFLKAYRPLEEIVRDCKACNQPTTQKLRGYSPSMMQRAIWLKTVETYLLYLTYSCTQCQTASTFPEIRTKIERRNVGHTAGDSDSKKEGCRGEYS